VVRKWVESLLRLSRPQELIRVNVARFFSLLTLHIETFLLYWHN